MLDLVTVSPKQRFETSLALMNRIFIVLIKREGHTGRIYRPDICTIVIRARAARKRSATVRRWQQQKGNPTRNKPNNESGPKTMN